MKSLVAYYSRYGNTARVADALLDALRKVGEANIEEIECLDKRQGLIKHACYKLFPVFIRLAPVKWDLKGYDLLCMGIPVWGGRPSAPVTKYLLLTKNVVGKKAICCYVYGFETSAHQCSQYVESLLKKKGFSSVARIFVHWDDVGNEVFLNKAISDALAKVSQ